MLNVHFLTSPLQINVSLTSTSSAANNAVRSLVASKITPLIRSQLHKWYKELREEFTRGMVLPTKDTAPQVK